MFFIAYIIISSVNKETAYSFMMIQLLHLQAVLQVMAASPAYSLPRRELFLLRLC